ncbi:MAG: hypothetical protein HFH14_07255 [Lachnospiraceae bacterium]|nr:hypothetical protein [Lachnospiraceae bacterium]
MAKTKIIIIQMKEIVSTAVLVILGILLIVLLVFIFGPKKDKSGETASAAIYNAGTYSAQISLNNTALNLEVTVDPDRVKSVDLVNIDESVTTMFPLLMPSLNDIETQLVNQVSIDDIVLSEDSRYTQMLLIESLKTILEKARIK